MQKIFLLFFLVLALPFSTLMAADAAPAPALDFSKAPKGAYTIDKSHAFVQFKVNHLGFSMYQGRFNDFDAQINFDPQNPEKSNLDAVVNMVSADSGNPKIKTEYDGEKFFNVTKFPTANFKSSEIKITGKDTGIIKGNLTFLGVTKPLTLNLKFYGYGIGPYTKKETLGFHASGVLKRSEWGMTAFIPSVGDDVQIEIEAEFNYNAGKPTDPSETYKE